MTWLSVLCATLAFALLFAMRAAGRALNSLRDDQ